MLFFLPSNVGNLLCSRIYVLSGKLWKSDDPCQKLPAFVLRYLRVVGLSPRSSSTSRNRDSSGGCSSADGKVTKQSSPRYIPERRQEHLLSPSCFLQFPRQTPSTVPLAGVACHGCWPIPSSGRLSPCHGCGLREKFTCPIQEAVKCSRPRATSFQNHRDPKVMRPFVTNPLFTGTFQDPQYLPLSLMTL